jgi:acyl-CoA thioester hydrolase
MTIFFDYQHDVSAEEIDSQNHVHNLRYLQWSLWAAGGHTNALGHDADDELRRGYGFVVREHAVVYRKAALLGDKIIARTWLTEIDDHSAWRQTWICRPADRTTLAKVKTRWVYCDLANHRVWQIPTPVRQRVTILETPPALPWA